MIKTVFLIIASCLFLHGMAQNECIYPMTVIVPQQVDSLAPMAQNKLESRIRQVVTMNGMEGGKSFSNFCIVANISEGSKEITHGLRPLVTITSDLELFVGNNYTGEKIASTSLTLMGAGRNESKAYTSAFGRVTPANPQLEKFLKDVKQELDHYYQTQIPNIIRQAKELAVKRNYEEALCLLSSVPTCCNAYPNVEECMFTIYQQFVDYDCAVKVNKAQTIWSASQDKNGAKLAGAYLASIDPSSSCWEDALLLAEKIRARIGDDWEFSKELARDSIKLENARIDAIRAIGVAFGENQKSKTIKENWLIR